MKEALYELRTLTTIDDPMKRMRALLDWEEKWVRYCSHRYSVSLDFKHQWKGVAPSLEEVRKESVARSMAQKVLQAADVEEWSDDMADHVQYTLTVLRSDRWTP